MLLRRKYKEYTARVSVYGLSAYVVDSLIGFFGKNREEVLEYLVKAWVGEHQDKLRSLGITLMAQ